jgi:hypothetical protein
MPHVGGKNAKKKTSDSKRHFTVVIGNKENGLYVSSSPSSAARKAVSKLCATDKKKKVQFSIREITQGSKKKIYGPYLGEIEKLVKPIELKGRVIRYKPVAKLSGKTGKKMKGGVLWDHIPAINNHDNPSLLIARINIINDPSDKPSEFFEYIHNDKKKSEENTKQQENDRNQFLADYEEFEKLKKALYSLNTTDTENGVPNPTYCYIKKDIPQSLNIYLKSYKFELIKNILENDSSTGSRTIRILKEIYKSCIKLHDYCNFEFPQIELMKEFYKKHRLANYIQYSENVKMLRNKIKSD